MTETSPDDPIYVATAPEYISLDEARAKLGMPYRTLTRRIALAGFETFRHPRDRRRLMLRYDDFRTLMVPQRVERRTTREPQE